MLSYHKNIFLSYFLFGNLNAQWDSDLFLASRCKRKHGFLQKDKKWRQNGDNFLKKGTLITLGLKWILFNPLTLMGDQDRIYP